MILLWRVSSKCNFSCGFCAYDRCLDLPHEAADPEEIGRVASLFAAIVAKRSERLLIGWLGGEPLLWTPLLSLLQTLADWDVDDMTFNQPGGRDRSEYFTAHILGPDDVARSRAIITALCRDLGQCGVLLYGSDLYFDRVAASSKGEPLPVADCKPGEDFYFAAEQGTIAPCSFTTASYGVYVSELKRVADVKGLQGKFNEMRVLRICKECDDCPSTQIFGKFAA